MVTDGAVVVAIIGAASTVVVAIVNLLANQMTARLAGRTMPAPVERLADIGRAEVERLRDGIRRHIRRCDDDADLIDLL